MTAAITFIHTKGDDQVETTHTTACGDFQRDDLVDKFKNFLGTVGYVFTAPIEGDDSQATFEME